MKTFTGTDGDSLSINPHQSLRWQVGGPISAGPFGPVAVINRSEIGQSWYEVTNSWSDKYVQDWVLAGPSVTVLGLGMWDMIMGHIIWTPECSSLRGFFSAYWLKIFEMFLVQARSYANTQWIDFDALLARNQFVVLPPPSWFSMTKNLETDHTISVSTWNAARKYMFRDFYAIQEELWERHSAIVFNPKLPNSSVMSFSNDHLLSPKFNKLYLAQVYQGCHRCPAMSCGKF